jgi:ferredoxin-nitrite reductase
MPAVNSRSPTQSATLALADHLDRSLTLDEPLNIHLTGCPNSCAQHYIGDIGLLATKVDTGDEEVEGYHLLIGGGSGGEAALAREIARGIPADELPFRIERLLRGYLAARQPGESFHVFANRHSVDELGAFLTAELEGAAA